MSSESTHIEAAHALNPFIAQESYVVVVAVLALNAIVYSASPLALQ